MKPSHVLPILAAGRNSQSFLSLHSLSACNAIYGHSPVPIPLSKNEYAGVREVRCHLRTRLLAPPVENVWKKASPLKVGRSPRGFCLQVFSNFCARLAASAFRSFQTSVLLVLWTGEWGQGNGRIFGLSVRDESFCLVRRHLRTLELIFAIPTCSGFGGWSHGMCYHSWPQAGTASPFFRSIPFQLAMQSMAIPLSLFPCPRTSTPGCVRCGAMCERVCSRPQSRTCGRKLHR